MSYATLNGADVLELHLNLPRVGVWHATVRVDSATLPANLCTLRVGGMPYYGTPRTSTSFVVNDTAFVMLVGGAGKMRDAVQAASYRNTPLSVPLKATMDEVGEAVAAESDAAILGTQVRFWTRAAGPAGRAVTALMAEASAAWRMLPAGTLWVGTEKWRPAAGEYELLEENPLTRSVTVFSEAPRLLPGDTLDGRPIAHVAHHVTAEALRTVVTFEDTL